ncbi:MAG: zinc metalloprotease HtpX [Candidatus Micrarchaeia archaeon]
MGTLWDEIAANKRKSWALVAIFVLFVAFLGFLFGYVLAGGIGGFLCLTFAGILTILLAIMGYYNSAAIVLAVSRARPATKEEFPFLINAVEGLAIAAGIPAPRVFVMDDDAPNAFAVGRDPAHAAVCVTTGLLTRMNRLELEGVLAHEISHIRNYDVRFATLAVVLVGVVTMLSDVFMRSIFRGGLSSRERRGGGAFIFLVVLAVLFAILSPLFANLLRLALSRQREYLADASAAQLTRYPEGLASALEKMARESKRVEAATEATAPLYIVNPLKGGLLGSLFSTHPPIEERIRRLRRM